jgi:hypothetical protein
MSDLFQVVIALLIVSIFAIGLFVGVLLLLKAKSELKLVYEVHPSLPLFPIHLTQSGYILRLEQENGKVIDTPLFFYGVRLINIGQLPITRSEINANDPLRIHVAGNDVVDIILGNSPVATTSVAPIVSDDTGVSALLDIRLLPSQGDCLFWVISKTKEVEVSVQGKLKTLPYTQAVFRHSIDSELYQL